MAILRTDPGRRGPISPFRAGLIAIVLAVVATYFAYTRANPFADAFELKAAMNTVNNLAPDSPVRIAGVEVGVVKEVESMEDGGDGAVVTMEIEDHGLPIHEDAELKVRPRIFLEGNEFVDLSPGSPSAPEADEGYTIPVNQTATPVQLGQVLSVLQTDSREDLKTFFREYSTNALKGGGARGFRKSIKYWEDAYRDTALASDALLGTQEGDLFRVLKGQQQTAAALTAEPDDLANLVTNFNTTAAALASEDLALQRTVPALRDVLAVGRPALESLNSSFPGVQRFAVDALPAVRSSQETVPEAFPFVRQLRLLFRPSELRGLAADLRRTIPPLARLNKRTVPLLRQNRALSACTNEVLLPFARTPIPTGQPHPTEPNQAVTRDFGFAPDSTMQPFYKQGPRAFVGLSGESRTSDANNKFFRANFKLDQPLQFFRPTGNFLQSPTLGNTIVSLGELGENSRPAPPPRTDIPNSPLQEYRRPAFRPDFPCELSVPPDLRAPASTEKPRGSTLDLVEVIQDLLDLLGVSSTDQLPPEFQGLDEDAPEDEQVEALINLIDGLPETTEREGSGDGGNQPEGERDQGAGDGAEGGEGR